MNDRFWAKVLFKEYIRHYRKLDDAQIVADVRKSMDDLEDLVDDADSFGSKMVRWSTDRVDARPAEASRENGRKGGRPKKSPQDAPNGNAGVDMSDAGNGAASKSRTSCNTFTADGDIREDSQAKPDGSSITRNETRALDALGPSANQFTADASTREGEDERDHRGNTGTLESSTSANIYGDAATREGAEVVHSRESGAAVPTTVSGQFRGSAKTRDTRDNSRGRYAPPSCSPEDGNPAETAPSHGGSVASLEARQSLARESRRTGGSSVRGMAKVAQPSVRSRASFRNKEDFIQWAIDTGLDPVDAGECWEATEERGGKDADGNTVKNMKAFARQWCRTRANNRRTA